MVKLWLQRIPAAEGVGVLDLGDAGVDTVAEAVPETGVSDVSATEPDAVPITGEATADEEYLPYTIVSDKEDENDQGQSKP